MPFASLIVATKGRCEPLERLLSSLDSQSDQDFEVLIVDQNDDDRLEHLIQQFRCSRKLKHLRCPTGVSRARNYGLTVAEGSVVAFPDDDCWYPAETLANIREWFHQHAAYDILSTTSKDANGTPSGNRWRASECDLAVPNIFRTTVCYCVFMRVTELTRTLRFDEQIGPGAGYNIPASEDTDFVLSALDKGVRGRFVRKWHVFHPRRDVRNASISGERAYRYGYGMGYVQSKHRLLYLFLLSYTYDMARAFLMMLLRRESPKHLWYMHGKGIAAGYRRL